MTDKLQKAIALVKSGDKQKGMALLAEVLRTQPDNELAWLWMSRIVPDDEQRPSQLTPSYLEAQSRPAQQDRLGDQLELIDLRCKNCGASIEKDHIVPRLGMARCSYCGARFGVNLPLQKDRDIVLVPLRYERPKMPMPTGVEIANGGDVLRISHRWDHWPHIFLAFFCLGWYGFLIMWYGLSITSRARYALLFGLIHIAIGIILTYATLAGFLNHTFVQVGNDELKIWHRPLPLFSKKCLQAPDIEQIYGKKDIFSRSYEVYALLRRGGKTRLLSNLPKPEQALYIEQELEWSLGIQDMPVGEEIPR